METFVTLLDYSAVPTKCFLKDANVKRKISCLCDNTFEVDVPEEINLELNPEYLKEILEGNFFTFNCESCGKKHKPEFPLFVLWPSKKIRFEIFTELDRGEFYRRKKPPLFKDSYTLETIIGYPEMADRIAVINDGFEPVPVEAIKYFLQLKAEEEYKDDELNIWYYGFSGDKAGDGQLEFHIHGIKENEVAVMKIPLALYRKYLDDYKRRPKNEIYKALRVRSYLSVKNTMWPEELR